MIELLFVTCLSAAPDQCQSRSLLFTEDIGLMTCMVQGQAQIARWLESHPRDELREWKCQMARQDGVSI